MGGDPAFEGFGAFTNWSSICGSVQIISFYCIDLHNIYFIFTVCLRPPATSVLVTFFLRFLFADVLRSPGAIEKLDVRTARELERFVKSVAAGQWLPCALSIRPPYVGPGLLSGKWQRPPTGFFSSCRIPDAFLAPHCCEFRTVPKHKGCNKSEVGEE